MARYLLILLGLLLASGLGILALDTRQDQGTVYSVADVRAGLERDPAAWTDRVIRLRAIPASGHCFMRISAHNPICTGWQPSLVDADLAYNVEPLPLLEVTTPPLIALLRRLPLLSGIWSGPQAPGWGTSGVYRVRLRAVPCAVPWPRRCYGAALVDWRS